MDTEIDSRQGKLFNPPAIVQYLTHESLFTPRINCLRSKVYLDGLQTVVGLILSRFSSKNKKVLCVEGSG